MNNNLITLHGLYGNIIMLRPDDILKLEEDGICTKVIARGGDFYRVLESIEDVKSMTCKDTCSI